MATKVVKTLRFPNSSDDYQINAVRLGGHSYDDIVSDIDNHPLITPVDYSELVSLRNNSELIPGMFYRITDYQCTTTQEDTYAANHRFDIIVQALSESTLSENASADYHINNDGTADGYFATGGLYLEPVYDVYEDDQGSAGEVYFPDDIFVAYDYGVNADGETVPVLYKTDIQSYPYEADYGDTFYYVGTQAVNGITYDKWRKIDDEMVTNPVYTWDSQETKHVLTEVIVTDNAFDEELIAQHSRLVPVANLPAWELKYSLDNDTNKFAWANGEEGRGVIYWMKDEWNNECPYDFKNIMFTRKLDAQGHLNEASGTDAWVYTFTAWDLSNQELLDASMIVGRDAIRAEVTGQGTQECYNNKISEYRYAPEDTIISNLPWPGVLLRLNNIVFINQFGISHLEYYCCCNNTFGEGCYSITFDNNCYTNTFGNNCSSMTFGSYCRNNTFGNDCTNNITDGVAVQRAHFGDKCSHLHLTTSYSSLLDITVMTGIQGTRYNPKVLTVPSGSAPVIFEAPGTTHIILD